MKSILILCRGKRVQETYLRLCKELVKKYKVVVIHGSELSYSAFDNLEEYREIEGVEAFRLQTSLDEFADHVQSENTDEKFREIEAKLGLSMFRASGNYALYKIFSMSYYKHWPAYYESDEVIRRQFIGAYLFFSMIFDRFAPELLFCETPDFISHRVAFALAQKREVFTASMSYVQITNQGLAFFANGSTRRNILLEHYFQNPESIPRNFFDDAGKLIEGFEKGKIQSSAFIKKTRANSGRYLNLERVRNWRPQLGEHFIRTASRQISKHVNINWLEKNLHNELPRKKFIYFPLQHQPEATTGVNCPRWVNQQNIVLQLAINCPADMAIVVKENPYSFGRRGREYFEPLKWLPNVHLLHPSFSSFQALRMSEAAITINGSVGLESILLEKRVGVLSNIYYACYPGVRKLEHPEDLYTCLSDAGWKPEQLREQRLVFFAGFLASTFYLGHGNLAPLPSPDIAGPNLAVGLDDFLKRVTSFGLKPSQFSLES